MASCFRSICRLEVFWGNYLDVLGPPEEGSFVCTCCIQSGRGILSTLQMDYVVVLLVFDVNHFVALRTLPDVATAVGLVQVDAIHRELLVAVAAFLSLSLFLHFQLVF